jgi:hypothetical protein
MTLWRTLALGALASMTVACSSSDKDTTETDPSDTTDTTDTTPEETAPTGSSLYDLEAIALSAEFAYNAETDSVQAGSFGGNSFTPSLTISLGTSDYFASGDEDEGCPIFASASGLPGRAAFAESPSDLLFGFQFEGAWTIDSSACEGILDLAEVDAQIAFLTDPTFLWGIGIQEDVGADAAQALAGSDIEAIGGGFAGSWNATDTITEIDASTYSPDGGYVQGLATDGAGEIQADGSGNPVALTVDEMVQANKLQTGYYIVGEVYYYTFQ